VLAPSEEKSDDSENSVYEELLHVCDHLHKCHKKIILQDFNANVGKENICKPTIGNVTIHEESNDNGVRIVNFATSKHLVVRSTKHS
jgi:phosphoribosylformylglycinamidine (FGAM) synthase-like enzyme